MRKIKLESVTEHTPQIFRVLSLNNLDAEWLPNQSILIPITIVQEVESKRPLNTPSEFIL